MEICVNANCGLRKTREWIRGWPLRSGGYALLCYSCGSAYETSVFCDTYHLEEHGWRECYTCKKRLHCGCIASKSLYELLDYGGVQCTGCAKSSRLHSTHADEIAKGFGLLTVNKAGDLDSTHLANQANAGTLDEGRLAELCRLMEANESQLLSQSEGADKIVAIGQSRQQEAMRSTGEIRKVFSVAAQSSMVQSKLPDSARSMLEMRDVHESHTQPSSDLALGTPYACGVDGRQQGKTPLCQRQRSRPILPKPSKAGFPGSLETNKTAATELRIARPPAEGRGKNQLLPRYWPRITDQELQQLSGDLNSNIVPLFEKVLSASDAGRIGRLVLPKACAEAYFPPINQSEGLPLRIQDVKGREWTFQFRFWPNNNSRMYVLEGVTPCIQAMELRAGDTITFSRIDPGGKLVVGYRKSTTNSVDQQEAETSALPNTGASAETSFSADSDLDGNKSENHGGRTNTEALQQPNAEKKRARNIGPKSKRLLMHSEEALELRFTWEEAQDLLRPPPSVKPSIVTIEDHEFEEYDEPPVFGKRTIYADRQSGGQEQWAQCDDCSKWRKVPEDALLPPRWTCLDNVWDSSRRSCSAPEEMSPRDLDALFRGSKDFKRRRTLDRHKPSPEHEPSGLDALASVAVLGDNIGDSGEPSVGATTKHPRHRSGCTCIVCIQPPSGTGKHKPTCDCNVCMTVKRRFKTLMLRKKKRQSEREAEVSQKDNTVRKDEFEMIDTVLNLNNSENEGNFNRKQMDIPETSGAQIDLNCHPNRDDMHLDAQRASMMSLADAAAFENYIKLNGLADLMCERQTSMRSRLHSQNNGESLRQLSNEAFRASVGWNHESGGN